MFTTRLCLSCVSVVVFSTLAFSAEDRVLTSSLAATPQSESGTLHFAIRTFDVQGNTLLQPEEITRLLKPFKGENRDFADVQQALDVLESAYRRRGYNSVSVYLPEQELKDGVVIYKVIEAKIADIKVEGNRFFTSQNILGSLPSLVKGDSPLVHEVSKNLRAANENPAKKVTLQLQQGAKDDEIIANLKVADERYWKIGLTTDNSGNKQTGEYRTGILLQHFNLHNKDHVATFQYTTAPDHAESVNSFSASYRLPLYSLGDTIDFFAGYSDVDSGSFNVANSSFSYNASNINGKGVVSGVRYNYTMKRYGEYAQKIVAGIDYRYYDNSSDFAVNVINGGSYSGKTTSKLVLHPLSATYNGTYTLDKTEIGLFVSGVYNIPWGVYGGRTDFPEGTASDYFILRYGANLGYALPADFQMRLSFNGQYTPRAVVAYEQIRLGGASSGRGYEDGAAAGDNGYSGTAELYSPDLARLASISDAQLRLVCFYDDGYVHATKEVNGDDNGKRASSAGGGVRLSISRYFTASIDWGVVLTPIATSYRGDSKMHFKASFIF